MTSKGFSQCHNCLKFTTVSFAINLFITGLALIGLSIWLMVDIGNYYSDNWDLFSAPVAIVMVVGVVGALTSFLGCYGATREKVPSLTFYSILLLILAVVMAAVGMWSLLSQAVMHAITDRVRAATSNPTGDSFMDILKWLDEDCSAVRESDDKGPEHCVMAVVRRENVIAGVLVGAGLVQIIAAILVFCLMSSIRSWNRRR